MKNSHTFALKNDSGKAKDDTWGHGVFAVVKTGFDWKPDNVHTLTPEIGLACLYKRTAGMDIDWQKEDSRYPEQRDRAGSTGRFFARASLRWSSEWTYPQGIVKSAQAAGVRQALSDCNPETSPDFHGEKAGARYRDRKTAGTAEAGLTWDNGPVSMSAFYSGDYGGHTRDQSGRFEFRYRFWPKKRLPARYSYSFMHSKTVLPGSCFL